MLHSTLLQSLQRSDETNWRFPGFIPEANNGKNDHKLLFVCFSTSNEGFGFFFDKKKSEMHTKNIARGKTSHIKKVNCFPNKFYYQTFN